MVGAAARMLVSSDHVHGVIRTLVRVDLVHVDERVRCRTQGERVRPRRPDVRARAEVGLPVLEDVPRIERRAVGSRVDEPGSRARRRADGDLHAARRPTVVDDLVRVVQMRRAVVDLPSSGRRTRIWNTVPIETACLARVTRGQRPREVCVCRGEARRDERQCHDEHSTGNQAEKAPLSAPHIVSPLFLPQVALGSGFEGFNTFARQSEGFRIGKGAGFHRPPFSRSVLLD